VSNNDHSDADLQELTRLSQLLTGEDILSAIGLPANPTVEDINRVFSEYARRFHPDRFHSTGDPNLVETAARLFAMTKNSANALQEQVAHTALSSRVVGRSPQSNERQDSVGADHSPEPASGQSSTDNRSPEQGQNPRRRSSDSGVRSQVNPKLEAAQGKLAMNQKRYAEAVDHFSKAVLASPESAEYLTWLGWAKFLADWNDHATAGGLLENATALDPNYLWPWIPPLE